MSLEDFCTWMGTLWGIGVGLGVLEKLAKTVSGKYTYRKDWRPTGKVCIQRPLAFICLCTFDIVPSI